MADESGDAPEVTTPPPAAPEAASPVDDEPRFTQAQVNSLVAAAKRKERRALKEPTQQPATQVPPSDDTPLVADRIKELDDRLARIDFREWAAEQSLNRDQRRYVERLVDIGDPSSWSAALESESSILQRLASESPQDTTPAPKSPVTGDAPGAARIKDGIAALTESDAASMTREDFKKMWNADVKGSRGNGLFSASNRRGK